LQAGSSLGRLFNPMNCQYAPFSTAAGTTSFDFVTAVSASASDSSSATGSVRKLPLTKIVATIGPTSEQREPLFKVVRAGMTVMRLNFSHATREEVELRCENLALAQQDLSKDSSVLQNCRSVLLDTKGPEIRTGTLANDHSGHETIALPQGHRITLHTDPKVRDEGSTATDLYVAATCFWTTGRSCWW
jgi:Pyruvate kinase, barrel domain